MLCFCNYGLPQECEKLGIPGAQVHQELLQLTSQLQPLFQELLSTLRQEPLGEALALYANFVKQAHGTAIDTTSAAAAAVAAAGVSSSSGPAGVLCTLQEVRAGTTEVPEGLAAAASAGAGFGAAAAAGEGISADWQLLEEKEASNGGISWELGNESGGNGNGDGVAAAGGVNWDLGDVGAGGGDAGGISWDVEVAPEEATGEDAAAGVSGGAVDWGITAAEAGSSSGDAGGAPAVNWDIEITEADVAGAAGPSIDWGGADDAAAAAAAGSGGTAQGVGLEAAESAVRRLVLDCDYRSELQDDLQELRAFLLQRRGEMRSGRGGGGAGGDFVQALLPEELQGVDLGVVEQLLVVVEAALEELNDKKLRQLLMIATSQR
jgi:hypothetical protein